MNKIMTTRVGGYILAWLAFLFFSSLGGEPLLPGKVTAILFWGGLIVYVAICYFWEKDKAPHE